MPSKPFKLYFKSGEIISLKTRRFNINEQKIVFYDSENFEIEDSLILFDEVSAIVPEEFKPSEYAQQFNVYLKKIKEPVVIKASNFSIDDANQISFNTMNDWGNPSKVQDLYISTSEIIAILPADKLEIQ